MKLLPPPDLAQMRKAALLYSLGRAAIFRGLPEEDLAKIAGYAELRLLKRGAYLFREGDPVRGFYIVRQGLIHVHRVNAEGGEQVIHLLQPGDSFAERAIVSPGGYPANARALRESEVILIPVEKFRRHQLQRPDLAWRMISSMSHQLKALVASVEGLRFLDVETRLVHWILQHCPASQSRKPVEIFSAMNQSEVAGELATRRETLSRMLRRLRARGLVEIKGRSLRVLDPQGLHRYFGEKSAGLISSVKGGRREKRAKGA